MTESVPATSSAEADKSGYREVAHQYTTNLPSLLAQLRACLLVTTYQAGKLVVIGVDEGNLTLSFHNFVRAMGLAVQPARLAVGARAEVWLLRGMPELLRAGPADRHHDCFVTRSAHFTGDIQAHEMAWVGSELWIVNTLFSCLCTLHPDYSFVPRWRPPFVSGLAAEDRCHLNGLAVGAGQVKYVTALAETDTPRGWRPDKTTTGCLIDVPSGATVARGFAMPHSPRIYAGAIWLLDSGTGRLLRVDAASGRSDSVITLPGYTRGLAFAGSHAFVGLSKIRETATFGGMPIAKRVGDLKCGVGVVDLGTGRLVAHLEFKKGVDEIFDVQVLPGTCFPRISGPLAAEDGTAPIWTVPDPKAGIPAP